MSGHFARPGLTGKSREHLPSSLATEQIPGDSLHKSLMNQRKNIQKYVGSPRPAIGSVWHRVLGSITPPSQLAREGGREGGGEFTRLDNSEQNTITGSVTHILLSPHSVASPAPTRAGQVRALVIDS